MTVSTKLVNQIQVKLHYTDPATLMANVRNIRVRRKTGLDGRQYVTLMSSQTSALLAETTSARANAVYSETALSTTERKPTCNQSF